MAIRLEYGEAMQCKANMDNCADQMLELIERLGGLVGTLQGSWEGTSASKFYADFEDIIKPGLQNAATNVSIGAANLKIDADRIYAADGN